MAAKVLMCSRTTIKSGAGVLVEDLRVQQSYAVGDYSTVFQSGVFGILKTAEH